MVATQVVKLAEVHLPGDQPGWLVSSPVLHSSLMAGINQRLGFPSPWSGFSTPHIPSDAVCAEVAEAVLLTQDVGFLELLLFGHRQGASWQALYALHGSGFPGTWWLFS